MKRWILFFIKGPGSVLLLVFAIFAVCYYVGKGRMAKQAAEKARGRLERDIGRVIQPGDESTTAPKEQTLLTRSLLPVNHAPEIAQVAPSPSSALPPPLALAAFYEEIASPTRTPEPTPVPVEWWSPPAEFIPCQLVNTVESSHINTPVMGIVTRDVWTKNNGVPHLIIPAGSHVSCFAANGAVRDRIEVAGTWLLTFPDNKQLKFNGIACVREADPANQQFGIEDGSAGLQGEMVETDHWANAKAFIALLITASMQTGTAVATSALQAEHTTGVVGLPDTTPILAKYLDQLLNGETGDSRFVRVRASTEFYVFPTDTILPTHRSIVTTSQTQEPTQPALVPSPLQQIPLQPNNENQTPNFRY